MPGERGLPRLLPPALPSALPPASAPVLLQAAYAQAFPIINFIQDSTCLGCRVWEDRIKKI